MPPFPLNGSLRIAVLLTNVFLGTCVTASAQEPYFPESVFFPRNKEVNAIVNDQITVHLKALKEPSLWTLSQKDRTARVYRFLWLVPRVHPICVRLTRTENGYDLHVTRHDGPPGLTAGRLILDKCVKLTAAQGETLVALVEKSAFWKSPVEVKEARGIADGDGVTIEGVKDGKYHVIDRAGSTTGETYKAFCRSLLELAGEPDALKAWDRLRQGERERPGYRPEPPQTEDTGEYQVDDSAGGAGSLSGFLSVSPAPTVPGAFEKRRREEDTCRVARTQ